MVAEILKGAQVVEALNASLVKRVEVLKQKGVLPTLAIVRVGERPDDLSYERGATKRCETIGVQVKPVVLPDTATQQQLVEQLEALNRDDGVHGVLLFRPLPAHMDENLVRNVLCPEKDVDGICDASLAGVFAGTKTGYPPCTAQACMEILEHFEIEVQGKEAVMIGRSLVVGKPAAMMLLQKNATVTVCHTKTKRLGEVCRRAQIVIAAAGQPEMVDEKLLAPGQIVIDVGIHMNAQGKLCGDVDFEQASQLVQALTPVPGGVGTVTTSVLVKHVVEAAEKAAG